MIFYFRLKLLKLNMLQLPDIIKEKIILDAIMLTKRELWQNVHDQLENQSNKPIISVCVLNSDKKLHKYSLKHYIRKNGSIILPKLITGRDMVEKFYSTGYVSRVSGIDCDELPYLDVSEQNILLTYN